jgi:hypothetical protein
MGFESSLIYDEVKKVIGDGSKAVHWVWECEFIAGGKIVPAKRIVTIDIVRDYFAAYGDVITLECLIPAGTYRTILQNYDDTLQARLYKKPLMENSTQVDITQQPQTQLYRATIIEGGVDKVKYSSPDNTTSTAADLSHFVTARFQLQDIAIEQIRMHSVSDIFVNKTPGEVLRYILGNESDRLKLPADQKVRGVNLVQPSNMEPRPHVIIPPTPVVDIGGYIQNYCGGVYSTGLGCYLQKGLWYVYPLADLTRFATAHKSLTIAAVPADKLPQIDRTYRENPKNLIILNTGKLKHFDNKEQVVFNQGNGVRFTDASKVMTGFGTYKAGVYKVDRGNNNSEFISTKRQTGLQNVATSDARITSNPFVEYSRIALRECTYLMFTWENSDESLIYPGMPAKFIYLDNDHTREMMGVVHKVHHFITGHGNSMIDNRHITQSVITLLVKG